MFVFAKVAAEEPVPSDIVAAAVPAADGIEDTAAGLVVVVADGTSPDLAAVEQKSVPVARHNRS